jgi:hypothetical protein
MDAKEIRAEAFNKLRSILKERSKGEVDTWGFVALFMDMIDEAEQTLNDGR